MPLLGALRNFEWRDPHALRIQPAHDVLDGAVFAAGIDALQNHQQRSPPFGIQQILQQRKPLDVFRQVLGTRLLVHSMGIARIDPCKVNLLAGTNHQLRGSVIHLALILHW